LERRAKLVGQIDHDAELKAAILSAWRDDDKAEARP